MQYIVLDMEWNQPWPGSHTAKKPLPSPIRGEIVQIGAVRLLEEQTVADEFQILIQPKYFKKMNRKVASDRHQGRAAARLRRSVSRGSRALSQMVRRGLHFPRLGL